MSGVDNRKQKGFVPQYGPGSYKGFGEDSSRSVTKPGSKEAGNGTNTGGYASTPTIRRGESERDD